MGDYSDWGCGRQRRDSPEQSGAHQLGPVLAQVSREASPLTLAVGRVEVVCRPHWQLSKHRSWGWEEAQLQDGLEDGVGEGERGEW